MQRVLLSVAVVFAGALGSFACSTTESFWVEDPEEEPSSDAGFDSQPAADSGLGVLQFRPEQTYSGFDGARTFIVPVAVYDSGDDLTVTATDPSAVEIVPKRLATAGRNGTTDNGKYFFVTVKKAGTVTLQARSQGATAEAKIDVAEYRAERWQIGEARYQTGGGGEPACATCHAGGQAIDHSPAALATATDEQIAAVITSGLSIGGFPIRSSPAHRWTATDDELDGLVTYLRALEPRGFE